MDGRDGVPGFASVAGPPGEKVNINHKHNNISQEILCKRHWPLLVIKPPLPVFIFQILLCPAGKQHLHCSIRIRLCIQNVGNLS